MPTKTVPIVTIKIERVGTVKHADRLVDSPASAATLCREIIANEIEDADRENFVAVYLNAKLLPVAYHIVSIGTVDATLVHPREVFKLAVYYGARSVVVGHNHPSGDPAPSREDRETTTKLVEAGKLLGIEVLDSLVIGYQDYVSLREKGFIS